MSLSIAPYHAPTLELAMAGGRATGLHVVHVTEAPLGGVLSYLQENLREQSENGAIASVHMLVPEVNVAALRGLAGPKVSITSFPHRRGSPTALLRLAAATVRLVRDTQPDILHVHSSIAGAVVRLALLGQRGRTKLVYTPHSWAFSRDSRRTQRLTRLAERWLSNLADSIVCVSEAEQRDAVAAGIAAEKCMVIQNGIAASSAASARVKPVARGAASKRKVLFVGRFDRQKGFDTFLDVMRRLGDEAEGLAVGAYVVGKAKAEEVPANVRLLGWRSREELAELYAEADLLLMPSRWEGLPLVALEAVRAGLPVFASRVGGLEEVILDGVTGRLFEADQPEATVAMIRATSRATLAAYGARGVARFLERFTAERMSRHLVAHYEDLLARGARWVLQNASVPVGA